MRSAPPGPSAGEVFGRIAGGEQGIRYDTVRVHKDGTVKDVSMVVSPVYDECGTMVGVSSVTRDISAQKRAETDLRTAEEKVNQVQRMASLGQLADGVAHDFNNLLGIMLSFIAFAEETVGEPDVRADLAKARLAGERAVDLTRQLLTFTRQDAVHPEMLDVNTCIAEVHAKLARTIGENIHLTAKPSPRPLTIHADPGQIQRILLKTSRSTPARRCLRAAAWSSRRPRPISTNTTPTCTPHRPAGVMCACWSATPEPG